MMQGAIPVSSQSSPADVIGPIQQSEAIRPTVKARDPQPTPPHCGHSGAQQMPETSMPGRPLLSHVLSPGSRSKGQRSVPNVKKGKKLQHTSDMLIDGTKDPRGLVNMQKITPAPKFRSR